MEQEIEHWRTMTAIEQESILALSLIAALADGAKYDAERPEVKRMANSLPHDTVQAAALYQGVLLRQVTAAHAAGSLHSQLRQLAYEISNSCMAAGGRHMVLDPGRLSLARAVPGVFHLLARGPVIGGKYRTRPVLAHGNRYHPNANGISFA